MILTHTPLQRPALNGAVVRPLLRGGLQAQPRSAMPALPVPRAPQRSPHQLCLDLQPRPR
jgi:hypothetical protein